MNERSRRRAQRHVPGHHRDVAMSARCGGEIIAAAGETERSANCLHRRQNPLTAARISVTRPYDSRNRKPPHGKTNKTDSPL
jgi:hypothetical protein